MATKWETRGEKLVQDLQLADTQAIEAIALAVMDEIVRAYPDSINSRRIPLSTVRKAVSRTFPDTEKQTSNFQYFTNSGKGNIPRYQHLALKYLTFSKEDWNAIGDDARKEYIETENTQAKSTQTIQPIKLSDMKIEQLELDTETQQIVLDALKNSEKSLAEFIQQACRVYAKTINGKHKHADGDLSSVLTSELLDPEVTQYKTHPGKIKELTKRAIKAIQMHNDNCTETDQKWFLSATAINGLTGSRVQSVNEVLKDYKQMIDDHNNKHDLTAYTNRGSAKNRQIHLEIPMTSLVPDGVDL